MSLIIALLLWLCRLFPFGVQAAAVDPAKQEGEVMLYTTMVVSDFQVFQLSMRAGRASRLDSSMKFFWNDKLDKLVQSVQAVQNLQIVE